MAKFDLYFECNLVGKSPDIKIGVDQHEIATLQLPVLQYSFDLNLNNGPHVFWVEMCSKLPENEIRNNGELVSDTWVQLKNLAVNGSMMNHVLHDAGHVCIDWNYHKDVADWFLTNRGSVPDVMEKVKYLNLKSRYNFKFSLPLRDFLDQHHYIDPAYQKLYNAPLSRFDSLKNLLGN